MEATFFGGSSVVTEEPMWTTGFNFDPTRQIAIIWDIADVQSVRSGLTDEQAMEVLSDVKRKHDATMGVCWDTLEIYADSMFPKG